VQSSWENRNSATEGWRNKVATSVAAPCVGIVLLNDAYTGEPFVSVGDTVKEGQLLFVIEAMKLFNDVTAPTSGRITQICVEPQQIVEYGTIVMKIEGED